MSQFIQRKGLDHIRYLKEQAHNMWEDIGCPPDIWHDCIWASMAYHRVRCLTPSLQDISLSDYCLKDD